MVFPLLNRWQKVESLDFVPTKLYMGPVHIYFGTAALPALQEGAEGTPLNIVKEKWSKLSNPSDEAPLSWKSLSETSIRDIDVGPDGTLIKATNEKWLRLYDQSDATSSYVTGKAIDAAA